MREAVGEVVAVVGWVAGVDEGRVVIIWGLQQNSNLSLLWLKKRCAQQFLWVRLGAPIQSVAFHF